MQIRTPDYISIYTENGNDSFLFSNNIKKDDITVDVSLKNELLHIDLTADQTPVKYISLRWNFKDDEKIAVICNYNKPSQIDVPYNYEIITGNYDGANGGIFRPFEAVVYRVK